MMGLRCDDACSVSGTVLSEYSRPLPAFVRMGPKAHPKLLELVFEFLRQIFDVVRWPILNVHAEVQTHA